MELSQLELNALKASGITVEQYQAMVQKYQGTSKSTEDFNTLGDIATLLLLNDESLGELLGILFMEIEMLKAQIEEMAN